MLLIEDNPADVRLVREMIGGRRDIILEDVPSLDEGIRRIRKGGCDVCLLDLGLPDGQGMATLTSLLAHVPDVAVVVLTGLDSADTGVLAVRQGAQDYLPKGAASPEVLIRAIRYSLERFRADRVLREREAELEAIYSQAPVILLLVDDHGRIVKMNATAAGIGRERLDTSAGPFAGEVLKCIHSIENAEGCGFRDACDRCAIRQTLLDTFSTGRSARQVEAVLEVEDAGHRSTAAYLLSSARLKLRGEFMALLSIENITERQWAEEALRNSEERYRAIYAHSMDGVLLTAPDGRVFSANREACWMFGREEDEICLLGLSGLVDATDPWLPALLDERARKGRARGELMMIRGDGSRFPAEVTAALYETRDGPLSHMIIRDITERKRLHEQLVASTEQLRKLAVSLRSAREHERSAIAQELHDDLGQMLTAVKLDLVMAERSLEDIVPAHQQPHIINGFVHIGKTIDGGIASLRRILKGLRPEVLDALGFVPALESIIAEFQKRSGIACVFEIDGTIPHLDRKIASVLFRNVQEALTNIMRHSGASEVRIHIDIASGHATLTVNDNGCGFDTTIAGPSGSLGILGMRERAAASGGTVSVSSEPARGTVVVTRLPLESPGDDARQKDMPT